MNRGLFAESYGNTAQFVGSVGDAFSAICCLQIFRFTSSKPSKSAIASDEKCIRLRTNSFVRYCPCPFYMIEFIIACFYGLSRETCGDFCRAGSERAKTAFPRPKTGICGFFFCEEHDILEVMKRERWSA